MRPGASTRSTRRTPKLPPPPAAPGGAPGTSSLRAGRWAGGRASRCIGGAARTWPRATARRARAGRPCRAPPTLWHATRPRWRSCSRARGLGRKGGARGEGCRVERRGEGRSLRRCGVVESSSRRRCDRLDTSQRQEPDGAGANLGASCTATTSMVTGLVTGPYTNYEHGNGARYGPVHRIRARNEPRYHARSFAVCGTYWTQQYTKQYIAIYLLRPPPPARTHPQTAGWRPRPRPCRTPGTPRAPGRA